MKEASIVLMKQFIYQRNKLLYSQVVKEKKKQFILYQRNNSVYSKFKKRNNPLYRRNNPLLF